MRKRLMFILCISFIATVSAAAQEMRTVTNSDLEKFRQKRLEAQREYRENYARLGFPSPEELEKQIEQSRVERSELSARLRAENLERERFDTERQNIEAEARRNNFRPQTDYYPDYQQNGFSGYAIGGFYNYPNFGYWRNRYYRKNYRRDRRATPIIDYRNNLPVIIQPPVYTTISPGKSRRRN